MLNFEISSAPPKPKPPHGEAARFRERRARAVDAARLCGAGARGLSRQRHRASRGAADRGECGVVPFLLYEGAAERERIRCSQLLTRPNRAAGRRAFLRER